MHWNSRNTFARQTDLFKAVRQRITSSGEVFALLRGIDEDIETDLALTQPDGGQWPAACLRSATARHRGDRFSLQRDRRPTHRRPGTSLSPDRLAAPSRELHGLAAVLQALKPIYRSDEACKTDVREKAVKTSQSRNAKVVRYILLALEKESGGADLDPVAAGLSIEHIFPQAADAGWDAFSERDQDTFVHRLGNLALLETALNRDLANAPYASKRPALAASAITTTRHLADTYDDWRPETLAARQAQMARRATAIWRIAQLS